MSLERAIPSVPTPPGGGRKARRVDVNAWAMAGVLAAMWAVLAILPSTRHVFLTRADITSLLAQAAVLAVVAVGMTMVVLVRGIDLSIGAGVALCGVVAAMLHLELGLPAPAAIAGTLAVGALIGAWHGLWVGWLGIPAFIVTLAGFKAYRGGALVLSNAQGLAVGNELEFINAPIPVAVTFAVILGALAIGLFVTLRDARRRSALGLEPTPAGVLAMRIGGPILLAGLLLTIFCERGMPLLIVIAAAVALWGVFVTKRTRFGRHLYAIGGNPEAARLSGINVKRTLLGVYVIMGVLTALAGVLAAARSGSVTPGTQGQLLELDAVTAVVIGGTSIAGGRGSIAGTILGCLVFATLAKAMNHLQVNSNWQLIIGGLILLAAVLVDHLLKGRRS